MKRRERREEARTKKEWSRENKDERREQRGEGKVIKTKETCDSEEKR